MQNFEHARPDKLEQALALIQKKRQEGKKVSLVGGGSDLVGMLKEGLDRPDVVVDLKGLRDLRYIRETSDGLAIGGLTTLAEIDTHPLIRSRYQALAQAAEVAASPQIRNVGTLGGNLCQRPWCWYFRQGFSCFKAGGNVCFAATGENRLHAIFGGGPSFIVHPSETAPALIALGARVTLAGPKGRRSMPLADFFVSPRQDPARENVLEEGEILAEVSLPLPPSAMRSAYVKVRERRSWDHAIASVAVALQVEQSICRAARLVLGGVAPVPWGLPRAEELLRGNRIDAELARHAGQLAIEGARPLKQNAYKVPLVRNLVESTLLKLAEGTA
ncbi:MAG: xanthine dehydrogenase family protein subunit M [Acidobacteria bacterium]|nr:xanthine dehydrogenase family protein subunit M [Acidobacteriota bacterium]